jgi:hypothetical protein
VFKKWIEDHDILQGFNITDTLLLELFAHMDPHNKGYLILNDWEQLFGDFKWNTVLLNELQGLMFKSFSNPGQAFAYFVSKRDDVLEENAEHTIDFKCFIKSLEFLVPKRFSVKDTKILWDTISKDKKILNYPQFISFFNPKKFLGDGILK